MSTSRNESRTGIGDPAAFPPSMKHDIEMVYFIFPVLDEPNTGVGVICGAAFRKLDIFSQGHGQPKLIEPLLGDQSLVWMQLGSPRKLCPVINVHGDKGLKAYGIHKWNWRSQILDLFMYSCGWHLVLSKANLKHCDSSAAGPTIFFLVWSPTDVDTRFTHILIDDFLQWGRLAFLAKNINKALSSTESQLARAHH